MKRPVEHLGVLRRERRASSPPDYRTNAFGTGRSDAAPKPTMIVPAVCVSEYQVAEIDHARVREGRLNLDISRRYNRPDVLQLTVNRARLENVKLVNNE